MTPHGILARLHDAREVVDQGGTELAALMVDLTDKYLAEVGPQVLDLLEALQPSHSVVGALQGITGQGGVPCVPQGQALDPGILPDLRQLLAGSCQDVCGIKAVHVKRPR